MSPKSICSSRATPTPAAIRSRPRTTCSTPSTISASSPPPRPPRRTPRAAGRRAKARRSRSRTTKTSAAFADRFASPAERNPRSVRAAALCAGPADGARRRPAADVRRRRASAAAGRRPARRLPAASGPADAPATAGSRAAPGSPLWRSSGARRIPRSPRPRFPAARIPSLPRPQSRRARPPPARGDAAAALPSFITAAPRVARTDGRRGSGGARRTPPRRMERSSRGRATTRSSRRAIRGSPAACAVAGCARRTASTRQRNQDEEGEGPVPPSDAPVSE